MNARPVVIALHNYLPELRHTDIAQRLDISRERVRQILGNQGEYTGKRCMICGIPRHFKPLPHAYAKGFCPNCWRGLCVLKHELCWPQFICEFCDNKFRRTRTSVKFATAKGNKVRFCSKVCQGRWFGGYRRRRNDQKTARAAVERSQGSDH